MKRFKNDRDKIIYCACSKIARWNVDGVLKCRPSCGKFIRDKKEVKE